MTKEVAKKVLFQGKNHTLLLAILKSQKIPIINLHCLENEANHANRGVKISSRLLENIIYTYTINRLGGFVWHSRARILKILEVRFLRPECRYTASFCPRYLQHSKYSKI